MTSAEILERLENLSGPSEEVDAEIVACLNSAMVKRYPPTDDFGPKSRWQFWSKDGAHFLGNEAKFPVPPYTKSLDATIELVEKMLPGWTYLLNNDRGNLADLFPPDWPHSKNSEAEAATMPIAICIALLKALEDGKP